VLATYQYDQIVAPGEGVPTYNYAGVTGPTGAFGDFNSLPKWQGNAFFTYNNGPFTGVIQAHVIGSGKFAEVDSNTGFLMLGPGQPGYSTTYPASINNNTVGGATYWNLILNYKLPFFNNALEVFGSLNNIFNRFPPVAPGGNGYPTNPVYFDTLGRTWRAGLRIQF
jgi:iron complex outermembrane recepter protein